MRRMMEIVLVAAIVGVMTGCMDEQTKGGTGKVREQEQ